MKKLKKNFIYYTIIVIITALCSSNILGEYNTSVSTTLMIDNYSARAMSLGGNFTAIADDIGAITSNPAGPSLMKSSEAVISYLKYPFDLNFIWTGTAIPLKFQKYHFGTITLSGTALLMQNFNKLNSAGVVIDNNFYSNEFIISLGYSLEIFQFFIINGHSLSIGFNAKYVNSKLVETRKSDLAFDFGLLYKLDFWGITDAKKHKIKNALGVSTVYNNLGPAFIYGSSKTALPASLKAGIAYNFISFINHSVLISFDFDYPIGGKIGIGLGLEYRLFHFLSLRVGTNFLGKSSNYLSLGASGRIPIKRADIEVGYALNMMRNIGFIHTVTINIRFKYKNKSNHEKKQIKDIKQEIEKFDKEIEAEKPVRKAKKK